MWMTYKTNLKARELSNIEIQCECSSVFSNKPHIIIDTANFYRFNYSVTNNNEREMTYYIDNVRHLNKSIARASLSIYLSCNMIRSHVFVLASRLDSPDCHVILWCPHGKFIRKKWPENLEYALIKFIYSMCEYEVPILLCVNNTTQLEYRIVRLFVFFYCVY